jgi:hypothetical protein
MTDNSGFEPQDELRCGATNPSIFIFFIGQLNALPHVHFRPINVVVLPRALPG